MFGQCPILRDTLFVEGVVKSAEHGTTTEVPNPLLCVVV